MESSKETIYDPWNILGKKVRSKHCEGKKSEIIYYEHNGALLTKCACGETYWHSQGAYEKKFIPKALLEKIIEFNF